MAAVTTRLRFLTYVYVLPMREPFSVAKQVTTLAMQSNYRVVLGVGTGWMLEEITLLGHQAQRRGRRMDEMIAILRDFWDDGLRPLPASSIASNVTGQFPAPHGAFHLDRRQSDAALRRAARNDGWAGMNYDMEEIPALLATLDLERRRHLERHGDSGAPFHRLVIRAPCRPARSTAARGLGHRQHHRHPVATRRCTLRLARGQAGRDADLRASIRRRLTPDAGGLRPPAAPAFSARAATPRRVVYAIITSKDFACL